MNVYFVNEVVTVENVGLGTDTLITNSLLLDDSDLSCSISRSCMASGNERLSVTLSTDAEPSSSVQL